MDLKKRPTQAKKISNLLKEKINKFNKEDLVKKGVDLVKLGKDLAKRHIENQKKEAESSEE